MTRFTPFPRVSCAYGAPTGRRSDRLDIDPDAITVAALAASGPQGEYDCGGVYWGLSSREGPVYAVWVRGRGRDGVAYVRAQSRTLAKIAAIEDARC